MNHKGLARWAALLVGSVFLGVAGCGSVDEETNEEATAEGQEQDLTATVAIYECRTGNNLTVYRRQPCAPGVQQQIGMFYVSPQIVPGITHEIYQCSRQMAQGTRHFVSGAAGRGCDNQNGVFAHTLGGALSAAGDGPKCRSVVFNRYQNPTTGDSRIAARAPNGYEQRGVIGGVWLSPITSSSDCCLSDAACGAGTICATPFGACTPGCRRNEQCPSGARCINDQCSLGCGQDQECNSQQICEGGLCRAGCRNDAACAESHRCANSACVPR